MNESKKSLLWVSACCYAPTAVTQPHSFGLVPADPITYCEKCEQKCEELGVTPRELKALMQPRDKHGRFRSDACRV